MLNVEDLSPEELAQIASQPVEPTRAQLRQVEAQRVAEAFMDRHENDFARTEENLNLLTDMLANNSMQPTSDNFEAVHAVLLNARVYDDAPVRSQAVAPVVTLEDVDRMSASEYKTFLQRNSKHADELEASRPTVARVTRTNLR